MVVYHSRPPPLKYFFCFYWNTNICKFIFIWTPPSANNFLFADSVVSIEKKHIKGGGLLW